LKDVLREFLAPCAVGVFHKLSFGQVITRSDIIRFLETRNYVDFTTGLKMGHEANVKGPDDTVQSVAPRTPRSILIAGTIDVCIDEDECPQWKKDTECVGKNPFIDYCKD
jgi:hypothetical protein